MCQIGQLMVLCFVILHFDLQENHRKGADLFLEKLYDIKDTQLS